MELGYARVSTAKQDLDRQIDALRQVGIAAERIYVDKKSGATTERPGLTAALAYAREGDVIVVHTLDRLGRTVRDTLNLIHDLAERGVGVRTLAVTVGEEADTVESVVEPFLVRTGLIARTQRGRIATPAAYEHLGVQMPDL